MANSLRDQFLKMGLVDKKQVSHAKKNTYKKTKEQDKGRLQTPDENKIQAQKALAGKKEQARIANLKLLEEARKNEAIAQIRQLIATNRLNLENGVIPYRFTDRNRVVRILLPAKEMIDELSQGNLAVVREKDGYAIVPSTIVGRIKECQPDLIVVHNIVPQNSQADPDDPYAAYKIPDDLVW
jgi:uncharacterized protein